MIMTMMYVGGTPENEKISRQRRSGQRATLQTCGTGVPQTTNEGVEIGRQDLFVIAAGAALPIVRDSALTPSPHKYTQEKTERQRMFEM